MKKLLYLIGGGILMAFALLCFFGFFFAWNITAEFREMYINNRNLTTDLLFSFSINERFLYLDGRYGVWGKISFENMLRSFSLVTNQHGNATGIMTLTREDWLQLAIFSGVSIMAVLKLFKSEWVSGKALGIAFTALAVLAAWVLIKDFVEQWRYMFGKDVYGSKREMWRRYYFGEGRDTSKFRVFLCIALHAGQNLLLVAAFASMAAVFMMPSFKNLFFVPAFVAAAYAAVMFLCHLTGWGFALKWGFGGALIFLIVDGLLAAGLFAMGLGAKDE